VGVITRAQRLAALRIIRGYRPVSSDSALFLAGDPPGDLLALERVRLRDIAAKPGVSVSLTTVKRAEREATLRSWQSRWERASDSAGGETAVWTWFIMPRVGKWAQRMGGLEVTYHLCHVLTGHGCFQRYWAKMGRATDPGCLYCGDPSDMADHTVFRCLH